MFILRLVKAADNLIEMIYKFNDCAPRSDGAHQGHQCGEQGLHQGRPPRTIGVYLLKELASRRRWCERARRTSAGRRRTVPLLIHLFSLPDY